MATGQQQKRRVAGAKTGRSEIVSVRLTPSLRYMAELSAHAQHRTLSSLIEHSLAAALSGAAPTDCQGDFLRKALDELIAAEQIILALANNMTVDQKLAAGEALAAAGVIDGGITRYHERRAVISKVGGELA